MTGEIDADTVSGAMEAAGLVGDLSFNTVSGDLTLAAGHRRRGCAPHTVTGRITADLDLAPTGT